MAQPNLAVLDKDGNPQTIFTANANGQALAADSQPVVLTALQLAAIAQDATLAANGVLAGAVNETAPASDTANSGQNGRLQRLAQRLTSLIALAASTIVATVSAVVTASSAYAAGNLVGTIIDFGACVGTTGGGVLQSVRLSSKSVQTATFKLYLFSQNPSNGTYTDKSAPGINAADIPFLIDVFTLSIADSGLGTHTIYSLDAIAKAFVTTNSQTHLFGLLITTGTPTFASTSDLSVSLGIVKDNA